MTNQGEGSRGFYKWVEKFWALSTTGGGGVGGGGILFSQYYVDVTL